MNFKIKTKLHNPKVAALTHKLHGACHLLYFSAVFLEGHGTYALMAGVLFFITLVGYLVDEAEG